MGNTESQPNSLNEEFIKKQQEIIESQQRQINSFTQLNNQEEQTIKPEEKPSTKINPFKILSISRDYNEETLKKAYLKAAMVTHPDRGGNDIDFKKVVISYKVLLKKLEQSKNNNHHNDLKDHSQKYMSEQNQDQSINQDLSKNFNSSAFNKLFDQNRLETVHDNGYSEWISENKVEDKDIENIFGGKYNEKNFTQHFNKVKQQQQKKLGKQLIKYDEPQVDISYKGKDSIMTLGQGNISDFSGESEGGLQFRDYKDAYSNTFLIDEASINHKKRPKSVREAEIERKQTSYTLSEEDQLKISLKEKQKEKEEQERIQRLQSSDQKYFDSYERVHQRMLGR